MRGKWHGDLMASISLFYYP